MTPTERRAALGAAVFLTALVLALAMRWQPAAGASRPEMRRVDQPACFPPDTYVRDGDWFGCPDTLPERRDA